jgi:hypothetical protein
MDTLNLLTIPVELREIIYEFLFSSYTIRHGFKYPSGPSDDSDSSNRIALLLSCRQVFAEANRHLPLNCTLHFRGTENLLETLLSVDQSVVTRLRHIRVRAFPFPLYASGSSNSYYPTYYAANALSLLPGLCLDTLVVEDCWHGFGMGDGWRDVTTYFDIESLLKSDAFKELTYITPCTDFIASGYDHRRKRLSQPETWDALIKERDGEEFGAEVKMYLVPYQQETATGDEKTEDGRIMQLWKAKPGHEVNENWRVAGPDQDLKGEVRVIAKRGKRSRAVQLGLGQKKTWKELKGKEAGRFAPEGESIRRQKLGVPQLTSMQTGPHTIMTWQMQLGGYTAVMVDACNSPMRRSTVDCILSQHNPSTPPGCRAHKPNIEAFGAIRVGGSWSLPQIHVDLPLWESWSVFEKHVASPAPMESVSIPVYLAYMGMTHRV